MSIIPSGSSLIQQLTIAYGRSEDAGYMTAAVMTILVYDLCTTIVDEVELVWRERWTMAKVLYLFARYYPPIFTAITLRVVTTPNHSVDFCQTYFRFISLGGYITFTTMVNVVFIMRVHALYHRSRKILIFFTILCLAEFGVEFYISWVVSQETANATFRAPLPGWRGCLTLPVSVRVLSLAAWSVCAGVGFVFFAFTMFKFKDSLTDDSGSVRLELLKDQRYLSPVLTAFMRDGAMFFFIILVTLIVNAVLTSWGNGGLGMFGLPWVPAIYSLVGSHMVLDLKRAGDQGQPTRISHHVVALNPMTFAPSRSNNLGSFSDSEGPLKSRV